MTDLIDLHAVADVAQAEQPDEQPDIKPDSEHPAAGQLTPSTSKQFDRIRNNIAQAQREAPKVEQEKNPPAAVPMSRWQAAEQNRQQQFLMIAQVHYMLRLLCNFILPPEILNPPGAAPSAAPVDAAEVSSGD